MKKSAKGRKKPKIIHTNSDEEFDEFEESTDEAEFSDQDFQNLNLIEGEEVLNFHQHVYVTNKRIIEYKPILGGILGYDLNDYSYKHIEGMKESVSRPLLLLSLVLSIIILAFAYFTRDSTWGLFFLAIGVGVLILGFFYTKDVMRIMITGGRPIIVPDIHSSTAARNISKILKDIIYQ